MTVYKTIPDLPLASLAHASDELEVNQAGVSRRMTVGQIQVATTGFINVRDYGAVGDGVTDDTVALQAAIDAVAAVGGGVVNCSGGRWLIDSADLHVKAGVYLVGPWSNVLYAPGTTTRDFATMTSSFVVNQAVTIRLEGLACGIQGMAILRKGLTNPTTIRQAYDAAQLFAGTAVTIVNHDTWLSNLLIVGFAMGITLTGFSRPHMQWISGDCTAGIYISQCFDVNHLSHCHFWSAATAHLAPVSYAVSNAVNNGSGLIRLTIAANVLQTGDRVTVSGIVGVPTLSSPTSNAFVVTVINPTTIDLVGSTFSGAYVSGGTVGFSAYYRSGVAFNFDVDVDWGQCDNCFSYGYAIGFRVNSCNLFTLTNCGADYYAPTGDASTVGILVAGAIAQSNSLVNCKTASQGVGLMCAAAIASSNIDLVMVTNHRSNNNVGYDYQIADGAATFVNCNVDASTGSVRIDDAANKVAFIGGDFRAVVLSYESAASPRVSWSSVRGQVDTVNVSGTLIGYDTKTAFIGTGVSIPPMLQVAGESPDPGISVQRYSSSPAGPMINMSKSAAAGSIGTQTIVGSSDVLGYLVWNGSDGTQFVEAASIQAQVDGTPGTNIMPARLKFFVSPSGTAVPVERLRISADGSVTAYPTVAVAAGAATQSFIKASSTANLGIYYGNTVPAFSAAKGSLYTNTAATTTTTRLYVNTDGASTWANFTASA